MTDIKTLPASSTPRKGKGQPKRQDKKPSTPETRTIALNVTPPAPAEQDKKTQQPRSNVLRKPRGNSASPEPRERGDPSPGPSNPGAGPPGAKTAGKAGRKGEQALLSPDATVSDRNRPPSPVGAPLSRVSSRSSNAKDAKPIPVLGRDSRVIIDEDKGDARIAVTVRHIRFGRLKPPKGVAPKPEKGGKGNQKLKQDQRDWGCLLVFDLVFSPASSDRFTDATVSIEFEHVKESTGRVPVIQAVEPSSEVKDSFSSMTEGKSYAGTVRLGAQIAGVSTEAAKIGITRRVTRVIKDYRSAQGNGVGTHRAKFTYVENKSSKSGIKGSYVVGVILACHGGPFAMSVKVERADGGAEHVHSSRRRSRRQFWD
ncbi:hypothetical protein EXIGLDRAFT_341693 [Exidia glandulosa HHB12029]|uniref:Uncharacterized protein n=1 Tax=Exidia glandulosa HHB12029 TaxID=1314781 RepID=A0A165CHM3_EXIGL|nr:hypothetical protein EXIGLDRAFT_341693 [Exidia glandulosa HHB12029]